MRWWIALLCVGVAGSAQVPVRNTTESEAALGAALAADIRKRATMLDSGAASVFVNTVGARLAEQLPSSVAPSFRYFVIAGDSITSRVHEPAALPGGYVFVPASLILAARDEAEFAGTLAHAMSHVAGRHGAPVENSPIPLIFMAPLGADVALPARVAEQARAFELQADAAAVVLMARAGYDPQALLRYIRRVQASTAAEHQQLFSVLPPREERLSALERAVVGTPAPTTPEPGDFALIQQRVREALHPGRTSGKPPSIYLHK
jgi:predicted Zn-dependent protease